MDDRPQPIAKLSTPPWIVARLKFSAYHLHLPPSSPLSILEFSLLQGCVCTSLLLDLGRDPFISSRRWSSLRMPCMDSLSRISAFVVVWRCAAILETSQRPLQRDRLSDPLVLHPSSVYSISTMCMARADATMKLTRRMISVPLLVFQILPTTFSQPQVC